MKETHTQNSLQKKLLSMQLKISTIVLYQMITMTTTMKATTNHGAKRLSKTDLNRHNAESKL